MACSATSGVRCVEFRQIRLSDAFGFRGRLHWDVREEGIGSRVEIDNVVRPHVTKVER